MVNMTRPRPVEERRHAMTIAAGLYVLRYLAAPSARSCPSITVNQHPFNHDIELIAAPGGSDTRLEAPGDCMIVRAEVPGSLSLVVSADSRDAAVEVEVQLESISSTPKSKQAPSKVSSNFEGTSSGRDDISVLAHVSRRGDVVARPGEWICGPDLPLPIEGLEIRWPQRPDGVELHYSAVSGRLGQKSRAAAGRFAGSRGKAASLTMLDFSLEGAAAAAYELRVEALFLGAAIVAQRGRTVSLSGPSGREPLVGLRLEIAAVQSKFRQTREAAKVARPKRSGKVRVYRAGALPRMPVTEFTHTV